jgi:hypothetical protein
VYTWASYIGVLRRTENGLGDQLNGLKYVIALLAISVLLLIWRKKSDTSMQDLHEVVPLSRGYTSL